MNISVMKKSELKELSLSEIEMILKKEWKICILNAKLRNVYYRANNDQKNFYIDILNAYFTSSAAVEISDTNPNYPYVTKANWSIFEALTEQDEKKFTDALKVLYLNGYLQKTYDRNGDDYDTDCEFDENFYQFPNASIPHESNLKWIYNNYPEQFSISVLSESDDQFLIEQNAHFFAVDDTSCSILEKMIECGTEADLLCSIESYLSLSHRGMYLLHLDQYHQNQNLINQQQSIIHDLQMSREKEAELVDQIRNTENKITYMHKKMQKEFSKHRHKIRLFYKDIVTILSILVAAFSVIGVNISTISKIDNNFVVNILIINLSLILVLITLFFLLKNLVFQFPGEKNESSWKWGIVVVIIIIMIYTILFYSGAFHSLTTMT